MNYIIGVGGVGSWLAHAMVRLCNPNSVILIDGDTLEEGNLDRQLFTPDMIGTHKAEALGAMLKCGYFNQWYSYANQAHSRNDWLLCCVDNNPARKQVLASCDMYGCNAIFAANETHSSESYFYQPQWKDTDNDPRVYYPEILSDETNDPARRGIGCTGEAQRANRQLVTANFMAAALASHLYVVWAMEAKKVKPEVQRYMPHRLFQTLTRNSFQLVGGDQSNKQKGKE